MIKMVRQRPWEFAPFVLLSGQFEVLQLRAFANYSTLIELWEECLQPPCRLDPDVKARIIGVQSQMLKFNLDLYFGLKLCERIFKITDNLSSTLQTSSL